VLTPSRSGLRCTGGERRKGCFIGIRQLQPQMPFHNYKNKGSHSLDEVSKTGKIISEFNQIPAYFSQALSTQPDREEEGHIL